MVLVTAANGKVGRLIIQELARRSFEIRAIDIDPRAESLTDIGASEVLVGDARDAAFMKSAMKGVEQVVYVPPLLVYDEDTIANIATDAALEAGVGQYVQMSVTHPGLSSLLQHIKKLHAEEHLKLQGFKHEWNFTILQPLHYMQNIPVARLLETKQYVNFKPLSKKLGYVDGVDIAEVVANVLQQGDRHQYATYELGGASFLSIMEIAEIFERLSGVRLETSYVQRENLFESEFRSFSGADKDSYARAAVLGIRDTYNDYGFAANKNVLEWLLGRESTTMEQYIRRALKEAGLLWSAQEKSS